MPENKCKTYGAEIKDGVCQDTRPNALICVNCRFMPHPENEENVEEEAPVENSEVETETSEEQLEVEAVEAEQEPTVEEE